MSNTTGATIETGTDYRSGALACARFVIGFDHVAKFFCLFFCAVFCGPLFYFFFIFLYAIALSLLRFMSFDTFEF